MVSHWPLNLNQMPKKKVNPYAAYTDELCRDPVRLKAFMRAVLGAPRRALAGQEYDDIMLLLKLASPVSSSNNQHTQTDEYRLGGKLYHVTYGLGDDPELEEVEDDIQQD